MIAVAAAVFVILVLGAYLAGWNWTGFRDVTLWQWLHLLVLPVTISFLPMWLRTHERHRSRWVLVLACLAAAFVVVVVGGYGFGWAWTGFAGNTLWDWIELLLLPFVLPAVLTYLTVARANKQDPPGGAHSGH